MEPLHAAGGFGDSVQEDSFGAHDPSALDGLLNGLCFVEPRDSGFDALDSSLAEGLDGAEKALWLLLFAECGTEFHHRLVVVSRSGVIEKSGGERLVGFGGVCGGFVFGAIPNQTR